MFVCLPITIPLLTKNVLHLGNQDNYVHFLGKQFEFGQKISKIDYLC